MTWSIPEAAGSPSAAATAGPAPFARSATTIEAAAASPDVARKLLRERVTPNTTAGKTRRSRPSELVHRQFTRRLPEPTSRAHQSRTLTPEVSPGSDGSLRPLTSTPRQEDASTLLRTPTLGCSA